MAGALSSPLRIFSFSTLSSRLPLLLLLLPSLPLPLLLLLLNDNGNGNDHSATQKLKFRERRKVLRKFHRHDHDDLAVFLIPDIEFQPL
jgi:hypothetical protein